MNEKKSPSLPVERLTWAVLLARWVDLARSALALPDDQAGRRLRESVPDLIMLQAVWFALGHMDELDADERALGLDRAAVLIDRHAAALAERFGSTMPQQVRELIDAAHTQWRSMAG